MHFPIWDVVERVVCQVPAPASLIKAVLLLLKYPLLLHPLFVFPHSHCRRECLGTLPRRLSLGLGILRSPLRKSE